MLYFKKVYVTDLSRAEVERLLRKASLKRVDSLDIISASTNIGTDKLFLGYEGKSALLFTRLHTSIENFLPKLVIKLPIGTDECYYQLRLKGLSAIVFFMFVILLVIMFYQISLGGVELENFLKFLLILVSYIGLILLEMKITTNKINRALNR